LGFKREWLDKGKKPFSFAHGDMEFYKNSI